MTKLRILILDDSAHPIYEKSDAGWGGVSKGWQGLWLELEKNGVHTRRTRPIADFKSWLQLATKSDYYQRCGYDLIIIGHHQGTGNELLKDIPEKDLCKTVLVANAELIPADLKDYSEKPGKFLLRLQLYTHILALAGIANDTKDPPSQ